MSLTRRQAAKKGKAIEVPAMTERELAKSIISAARQCGWKVYHTFLSKWSEAGFPDLILARDGRILAFELKSAKGKVSESQQEWLDTLALVPGVDARVVRPADLESAYRALVSGKWPVV